MTVRSDEDRKTFFTPILEFSGVRSDQATDAINALVDDLNQQIQSISVYFWYIGAYTVSTLPTNSFVLPGSSAYVKDGSKVGERVGAGTGVMAYFAGSTLGWLTFSSDQPLLGNPLLTDTPSIVLTDSGKEVWF
jgi:hypothetical protein